MPARKPGQRCDVVEIPGQALVGWDLRLVLGRLGLRAGARCVSRTNVAYCWRGTRGFSTSRSALSVRCLIDQPRRLSCSCNSSIWLLSPDLTARTSRTNRADRPEIKLGPGRLARLKCRTGLICGGHDCTPFRSPVARWGSRGVRSCLSSAARIDRRRSERSNRPVYMARQRFSHNGRTRHYLVKRAHDHSPER